MNTCSMYLQIRIEPPSHWTPLRASAHLFALKATGNPFNSVALRENKTACRSGSPAWDVYVLTPGKKRGKCIGTMIDRACEAFGPYHY